VPGPEAEIRRLRRRVLELEETNRSLHERNQGIDRALAAANGQAGEHLVNAEALRDRVDASMEVVARIGADRERLREQVEALTRDLVEARATAATETKRADHHAAEHAAAVKELAQAKAQKGGKR